MSVSYQSDSTIFSELIYLRDMGFLEVISREMSDPADNIYYIFRIIVSLRSVISNILLSYYYVRNRICVHP